jgi:hypothetical protein
LKKELIGLLLALTTPLRLNKSKEFMKCRACHSVRHKSEMFHSSYGWFCNQQEQEEHWEKYQYDL